ncbi:autophagy-related protein 2 homolog A [Macrosteles quadrilineatus]|uniref:autophagy-related protein 2 homolog A n=1 Tax=Macrosteles quadrilineatus TaxID=74068 RepID=UPI0023E2CDE1|nr:autophagy-related protein 2 homolog A [Macrosteles quadrilineatus]
MWFQYIPFSDNIKKRAIRYLLQRYLGQFFEEKLTLDQLTVDLYNGTGSVTDVSFDVQALNDLGEQHNVPFEFVDGYISEMSVSIPWASLLTQSSYVEVSGMVLTVQPKQRQDSGTSMFESMWSSMSSSMQLAAECMKQNPPAPEEKENETMEGLEMFAKTIDSILSRIKVKFLNSTIRLEHLPKGSKTGVALEIKIRHMDYCDEAGVVNGPNGETNSSAFSVNKFHFEGVSFHSDEFPAELRTFSRSLIIDKTLDSELDLSLKTDTKPIIIAKLGGRQEVRLKIKKGENIQGPKVDLELNLGSLTVFLSPRQLHLLLELVHGLAAPDTQDDSNVARCSQKPMESGDFDKVEQQLMSQLQSVTTRGLHTLQGWSSAPLDDSDEEFLPVRGVSNNLSDSVFSEARSLNASFSSSCSSYSKSNTSVSSSTAPGQQTRKKKKEHKSSTESGVSLEESHLHVRLSSLAVVLLHEDILTVSPETGQLTQSSLQQMDHTAQEFFNKLGLFAVSVYGRKDFEVAKQIFLDACQLNHIRLLAAPVIMESDEKRSTSQTVVGGVLTAACVQLLECLVEKVASSTKPDVEYVELLKFEQAVSVRDSSPIQPDLRLQFRRTSPTSQNTVPRVDISILLQNCQLEVDMSIVDRISAVLNPQPLCSPINPKPGNLDLTGICQPMDQYTQPDCKSDFKISCPLISIKLRFPIPDLRPLYDMDRPPWWKRNVRKDILFADFEHLVFFTSVDSSETSSSYEVKCKALNVLFQEGDTDNKVPIAYAQTEEKTSLSNENLLRFVLRVNPAMDMAGLEEDMSPELPNTAASMMHSMYQEEPSPFSSKRVVHESDTPHQCDGEELIIPGDREEMDKFIKTASKNTKLQIQISLPKANVHFPSKHIYEVVYNRLSTDLSLWSPSPQGSGGSVSSPPLSAFVSAFTMCKSAIQFESDSESEDGENQFYSAWETKPTGRGTTQSRVTVNLSVGHGTVSLVTSVKNPDASSSSNGHIQLLVKEVDLFAVTGFKGVPQQNYICSQINSFNLLHCSEMAEGSCTFDVKSFAPPDTLSGSKVIYKTEAGAVVRQRGVAADMLSVAVSSRVDDRRIKLMRVACGIRGGTLRHKVTHSHHSWLMQLLDMFDVMDYPVAGYQPSQVILELHQHLWDCVVDYRPVNLPMRCLLSVGSLSISSNMAARTSCSTLRFIAEDAYLFISDKTSPTVDIRLDYICVLDLGLFELSLRMSESPRVDLRASNNVVHIRTCSDSARLLAQLITYLASSGDLETPESPPPPPPTGIPGPPSDMSASTVQRVNTLMEDAMIDDITKENRKNKSGNSQKQMGVEVFLFPDETVHITASHDTPVLDTSDTDSDEFVMVEHSGLLAGNGMPEVRILTATPILVVENHFCKPTGKTDFLKAPPHFPAPTHKYTLREMTLVWHMYGGSDFTTTVPYKKHVTIHTESGSTPSSPATKRHVNMNANYSKTCPQEVNFNQRYSSEHSTSDNSEHKSEWWTRGGVGRQHDMLMELQLNKVRFQHEVYPDNTTQASRQVLLIHEVDIRDRLAVSKINKFLYQYTSESRPRQSHANMVVVKATHLRPDPLLPVQECCLRVSLLPLRLNIDQDSLLFLITFSNEIAGFCEKEEDEALVPVSPKHLPPVMGVDEDRCASLPPPVPAPATQLLIMLNDTSDTNDICDNTTNNTEQDPTPNSPIFFRRFEFTPEVPIRLDYEGKHVDMKHGPLAGLLMGLAQLNCSELRLKRLSHRHGLLGFEKLLSYIMSEWLSDIKKNQLPSLLGGVGPMYSVVQLFQGIRDLFWLPIEQYQKDGRIVRGLQRGANSFTTSTAMAALELTTRIVHAIQSVAETAFDMVSPGPSVRRRRNKRGSKSRSRYTPPADFREGVTNAVALVKEGIGETAHTLVQEALAEHEDKGAFGAVGGVLRQIPPTMVAPIILASAATSNLLGGVRSQLVPDARREAQYKWRDQGDKHQ